MLVEARVDVRVRQVRMCNARSVDVYHGDLLLVPNATFLPQRGRRQTRGRPSRALYAFAGTLDGSGTIRM
jgi:hypothetical protein